MAKFTDEYYSADFDINPTYVKEEEEFVQVSKNEDKSKNKDLRKIKYLILMLNIIRMEESINLTGKRKNLSIIKMIPIIPTV